MLFWQWCLPHRLHMLSLTFGNPSTCTDPLMHWSCHFFHGFCCISPALFCPYYCLAFPRFATSSPQDIRIRFVSHTRHIHYGSTSSSPPAIFGARQRTSNCYKATSISGHTSRSLGAQELWLALGQDRHLKERDEIPVLLRRVSP